MATTHTFRTVLAWSGSTGVGYDAYDRTHTVEADGVRDPLRLAAAPAFLGDASLADPEQLVVAAASSCQLLSFLAVAARARLDVVSYRDDARGVMPGDDPPLRITRIELRPVVALRAVDGSRPDDARLRHLTEVAHRECFIAHSLRAEVVVDPTFAWVD